MANKNPKHAAAIEEYKRRYAALKRKRYSEANAATSYGAEQMRKRRGRTA